MRSFSFVGLFLLLLLRPLLLWAQPTNKRVEIDKTTQTLRAFDGNNLVFESNISTGKWGKETPNGRFSTTAKYVMHHSSLYDNAPMPFSVQVSRNYFIHGYSSVPNWPASHGCIRMPIDAARTFFSWVPLGTPVRIYGHWQGGYGSVARSLPPAVAERRQAFQGSARSPRGPAVMQSTSRSATISRARRYVRVERAIPVQQGPSDVFVVPVENLDPGAQVERGYPTEPIPAY